PANLIEGTVVHVSRTDCEADVNGNRVRFHILGGVIRAAGGKNPVRVGDRVRLTLHSGTIVLDEILPRDSTLQRTTTAHGRTVRREVAANLALAVFVIPAVESDPAMRPRRLRLLDRMLVSAEYVDLPSVICLNKIDLLGDQQELEAVIAPYRRAGYPVLRTCALAGDGVEALRDALPAGLAAFVGPSGAGKTSLITALTGRHDLKTLTINSATGKGRHATTSTSAHELDDDRWVVDVPGLRSFGLDDVDPGDLAVCFVDFHEFLGECKNRWCTHMVEPGCAVRAAVDEGTIAAQRYESYRRLMVDAPRN
ncbi:MAG TPA: ribosome small subunit-dependent GTPase A, partial [Chloroflexota bacterium]|nr:ribosome small subunit-dependent GTPase A [Chloroflexota bacterium]